MIKINLCPLDELESQYWWVPEAVLFAVVGILCVLGVEWYHGQIQDEIDANVAKAEEIKTTAEGMQAAVARAKQMEKDEVELRRKLDALKLITVSPIAKYKHLIAVEHMANLRPEGVWITYLKTQEDDKEMRFELKGQAFDNLLIAEMISGIRSTISQEADESDLRTMIYFDQLDLDQTSIPKVAPRGFPELVKFPEFLLTGGVIDRAKQVSITPKDEDKKGEKPPLALGETVKTSKVGKL